MGNIANHHKINYIEFASKDIAQSKKFYSAVFGWSFEDWGPEYISFSAPIAGIDGGFRLGEAMREVRWWCFTLPIWGPLKRRSWTRVAASSCRHSIFPEAAAFISATARETCLRSGQSNWANFS
jgi:hypothetical protein